MRFLLLLVMKPAKQGVQRGWVEGNAGASGKKGSTDAVDVRPDAPLIVTTQHQPLAAPAGPAGALGGRWAHRLGYLHVQGSGSSWRLSPHK